MTEETFQPKTRVKANACVLWVTKKASQGKKKKKKSKGIWIWQDNWLLNTFILSWLEKLVNKIPVV